MVQSAEQSLWSDTGACADSYISIDYTVRKNCKERAILSNRGFD